MATTKEFKDYVMEQLQVLGDVRYRSMMGEYLVYYKDKYVIAICDDRALIKITATNKELTTGIEEPPYEGAKPMLVLDDLEDTEKLRELVIRTFNELPEPKKKKK